MDALLTPRELAEKLAIKPKTLEAMRHRGTGPAYVKAGRSVRYREGDVNAWLEENTRGSTSG